jgi:hypothetical protein
LISVVLEITHQPSQAHLQQRTYRKTAHPCAGRAQGMVMPQTRTKPYGSHGNAMKPVRELQSHPAPASAALPGEPWLKARFRVSPRLNPTSATSPVPLSKPHPNLLISVGMRSSCFYLWWLLWGLSQIKVSDKCHCFVSALPGPML